MQANTKGQKRIASPKAKIMSQFSVSFGVMSVNDVPANAAVLLNERKMNVAGEYKNATEFLAIEGVKSTDSVDLIIPVLAVMLADVREREGFKSEYQVVILDGKEVNSKITAKSIFARFLKGNVVYKSNGKGELNKALVLDDGLRLSQTSLKITPKQPIFEAKAQELRVIMHQTAKAICKQATLKSNILGTAKSIFVSAYSESKPAQAPAKKNTKKQTTVAATA